MSWPSSSAGDIRHASDGDEGVTGLDPPTIADADSLFAERRPSNLVTQDEIDFFRERRSEGKTTIEIQLAIERLRRRNQAIKDVNASMQHELSRVKANRLYLERMLSEQIQESH
jgi:hypothetical protein